MKIKMGKVLGIDLGTTYSCVAYMDENNKPVVLKNSEGELTTPSVVFFETAEDITVGSSAKESSKMYPDKVVSFIKRSIGQAGFSLNINDVKMAPEEISSYILKKVVNDAIESLRLEGKLGDDEDIKDVVITCPAYFGVNERSATEVAGEIAGLNILQIINEPTAAAITYGVLNDTVEKTVLVYDLGGGTFDITMINIKPGEIRVICTGGDHNLGGKDWDDRVIMYLAQEFQNETGMTDSILEDPETLQELFLLAERAKKLLSSKEKAPITINHMGERVRIELTREKFDELTIDLAERTISLTNEIFEEAKKKGFNKEDVNEILLVGGSSKMPQVMRKIKEVFDIEAKMFDPDESVAKGAVIYADKINDYNIILEKASELTGKTQEEIKEEIDSGQTDLLTVAKDANIDTSGRRYLGQADDMKIINVTSRSFGTCAYNSDDEYKLYNIILKNDELPKAVTDTFYTRQDNQSGVLFKIFESLSSDLILDPDLGNEIGEVTLELPEGVAKSSPIEVTFRLNEAGLLDLKAVELGNNRVVEASFETTDAITEEEKSNAIQRSISSTIN